MSLSLLFRVPFAGVNSGLDACKTFVGTLLYMSVSCSLACPLSHQVLSDAHVISSIADVLVACVSSLSE